jgi:uncharacterized protein (TIGR03032 family)
MGNPGQLLPHERGSDENANPNKPQFELHVAPTVGAFFNRNNISLLVTAYKSNLIFAFGGTDDGRAGAFYTEFPHPMAISLSPRTDCQEVWVACQSHLVRCADAGGIYNEGGPESGGGGDFTTTLVPRTLHAIGKQDVHGIYALDPVNPYFLSTKYSALCRLNTSTPEVTTEVVWKPEFITELRPEDRCHLNAICFVEGKPKYACCVCESDAHDGWRDHRAAGGVIIDIETNKIITRGLSMPHNPIFYRGLLWILNSGTGELGIINSSTGQFEPKVWLPGFLRGLQFAGRYAIVGSSLDRHERRFQGLELGERLEKKKTTPVCGVFIVDLADFSISEKIEIKGNIHELYDLAIIPGHRCRLIGINDDESKTWFNVKYVPAFEPAVGEPEEKKEEPQKVTREELAAKLAALDDGKEDKYLESIV